MTRYRPGNLIRQSDWPPGQRIEILHVGARYYFAADHLGEEWCWLIDTGVPWEPYVEPVVYPERWINVSAGGASGSHQSRRAADVSAAQISEHLGVSRIGVLHLFPDGHTEMEAP